MKKIPLLFFVCMAFVILGMNRTWAAELAISCVDSSGSGDYMDLQSALTACETNTASDLIKVAQGTYTGGFSYDSSEGYSIELQGGYEPGTGCATRDLDPANTILDGGESDVVIMIHNREGGSIKIEGFTIQNGNSSFSAGGLHVETERTAGSGGQITIERNIITNNVTSYDGGGIYARSFCFLGTAGDINILKNIITNNTSTDDDGGGVYAYSSTTNATAGSITLTGNTINNNSADDKGGSVYASSQTTGESPEATAGDVTITHNIMMNNSAYDNTLETDSYSGAGTAGDVTITGNIIAENTSTGPSSEAVRVGSDSDSGTAGTVTLTNNTITGNSSVTGGVLINMYDNTVYVYNNIIWGNDGSVTDDIFLVGTGTSYGYNNDYTTGGMSGSWTYYGNNIGLNPRFTSNYHLKPRSPCIDTGDNSPPGGLSAADIDGDNRIIDGDKDGFTTVDMGADESPFRRVLTQMLLLLYN